MMLKKSDTVGAIVTRNLQAAAVFGDYGIDYYSQGNRTLEDACLLENVAVASLLEDLSDLRDVHGAYDFTNMSLSALSTYILRTHHKFTEKKLRFIRNALDRLTYQYGEAGPKVLHIREKFESLSVYLTVHMKHEEFIVFPFIHKMCRPGRTDASVYHGIRQPITAMISDHDFEVNALKTLAELTDNYTAPNGADYSVKIAFTAMKELQEDLKIHMHLENNILFPKAIDLARAGTANLN